MDKVNQYFLELPQHLRHLVAKDAPESVKAIKVEIELETETIPFLAAVWPLISDSRQNIFQVRAFISPLSGVSKTFIQFSDWLSCNSQAELEKFPLKKLKSKVSKMSSGGKLIRHFASEGFDEKLELYAQHDSDYSMGCWKMAADKNREDPHFAHQIFSSYREFCEIPDDLVQERIYCHLADADTDMSVSHHWMNLNATEQADFALACEQGRWHELETLFRCLLRVFAAHLNLENEMKWFFNEDDTPYFYEELYSEEEIDAMENYCLTIAPSWRDKIFSHFKPRFWPWTELQPLCISMYGWSIFPISEPVPTAHELLEAQLHLSQWAHKHCTPAEAATLLQFES